MAEIFCKRGDGMIRVVFTGSECTGKSTLARRLAAEYAVPYSREFSRAYAVSCGHELTAGDVEPIAHGQIGSEDAAGVVCCADKVPLGDAAAAASPPLLLHDTDLISTVVYARHYYGACPAWIVAAARARRADLYLLCHPDVAWIADPQRDRGERRAEMHALFAAALREFSCGVVEIRGAWSERENLATAAVASLLRPGFPRQ